jgi:glycosyltransferase involved in cell wall biosynthesis
MRTLHVAAMPFPTQQGTQAAIHSMLCALAEAGHDTHLLCYADQAFPRASAYRVHRAPGPIALRTLRSGPSLEKLLLDGVLSLQLRRLVRALEPDLVVAHHVEAAASAWAVGARPFTFFAHTSLRTELPTYFAPALGAALAWLGGGLDRFLCQRADRVLAVSPLLAELLAREGAAAAPCTLPWRLPPARSLEERRAARAAYGIAQDSQVALYAGNLDGYQGLDALFEPLARFARRNPRFVWLIATASSARTLRARLSRHGLSAQSRVVPLGDEAARRRAHAAADLALVPRAAAGGFPIKLLDAMARGVPVLAAELACAGLAVPASVRVVAGGAPAAWYEALAQAFDTPLWEHGERGREHVAQHHRPEQFVSELCAPAAPGG